MMKFWAFSYKGWLSNDNSQLRNIIPVPQGLIQFESGKRIKILNCSSPLSLYTKISAFILFQSYSFKNPKKRCNSPQGRFERESTSIGEKGIFIARKTYEGEKYLTLVLDWIHSLSSHFAGNG